MGEANRKLKEVTDQADNGKKPSATMAEELRRLIGNLSIAQQQFNEFVVYCRKELGCPEGWKLDVQKLLFVEPPEEKKAE